MKIFIKRLRYFKRRKQIKSPGKIFTPAKTIFAKISALKIFIIIFLGLVTFIGIVFVIKKSELGLIKEINIAFDEDNSRVDKESLRKYISGALYKKNILLFNFDRIEEEMKKKYLVIDDLKMIRKFPSKLEITIMERRPLAIVSGGTDDEKSQMYLLDETGLIFARAQTEKLPLIKTQESISLSDRLSSEKIVFVLKILVEFDPESISAVEFDKEDTLQLKIDNQLVLFSLDKPVQQEVDILKIVLKSYKIKNISLKKIDLRFERPVVSY